MVPTRFLALCALAACALVLLGCPDEEKNYIVYQSTVKGTGDFPGPSVAAFNLGLDGRSLSNPGEDVTGVRFFNSGRGTAVVLFATDDGTSQHLYAAFLEGVVLSQPVELTGVNQDPAASPNLDQAFVAFLWPGNDRDGDALVGFVRTDLNDDGDASATIGPNARLYASYFDRTYAFTAVHPTDPDVRFGFDAAPPAVDLTDDTFFGSDVTAAGFVSDGLRGGADFYAPSSPSVSSCPQGDATTYLAFTWVQANASGAQQRLYSRFFDPSAANTANAFDVGISEVALDFGAAGTDAVYSQAFCAYENCVFFLKASGADYFLMGSFVDTAGATPAFLSNAQRLSPSQGVAALPGAANLYGPDEGLANVYGVYTVFGTNVVMEHDVYAFQLDHANATNPFVEADDAVQLNVATTFPGSPASVSLSTVCNRTGTWIAAFWIREPNPAMPAPVLMANAIQTTRSGTVAALGGNVAGETRVDLSTGAFPVDFYEVQQEVAYRGVQSDPDVFTVAHKHDAGAGVDTLRVSKVTFAAGAPPTLTVGGQTTQGFKDGTLTPDSFVVAEGGSAGATTGDAFVYFIRDVAMAPQVSFRAFQMRPGSAALEIGSLTGGVTTYSPREAVSLQVRTLPADTDIAANPGWAGRTQHVFLAEYRALDSTGSLALRHRAFDMTSTAAAGAAFTPAVDGATPPVDVDTGQDADAAGLVLLADGERLGAYFGQGGHLWYNEFSGGAWYARTGDNPGPQLVDHLEPSPLDSWQVFGLTTLSETGGLPGSTALFTKTLYSGGTERLLARVRNR